MRVENAQAKVKHEKVKQKSAKSVSPNSTTSCSTTPSPYSSRGNSPHDIVKAPQFNQVVSVNYLNITPSIEDRATAFFLSNYVIGDNGPTRGHLDHLSDLYESDSIDDNLVAAVQALTNAALQSPTAVKRDSTLLAILILGIFETITGKNQKSMKAWAEHIHGAAAVVKLRGPEAIKKVGGIRLLAQVTSSLLISCIQRDIPIPKYIVEITEFAQNEMTNIDPAWIAQRIMIDYTSFNAKYHAGYYSDAQELLDDAEALDERFLAFFTNIPKGWEYTIVQTDKDSDVVFDGYYHVYYDHWVAQIWNAIRELRILLNETIREVLLKDFTSPVPSLLGSEYAERFQICTEIVYHLQAEILASVPQHMGYVSRKSANPHLWSGFEKDGFGTDVPTIRFSGGYFLIWPLFLVGNLRLSTPEARAFCVKNLRHIGTQMGIEHANLLASIVEKKIPVTVWEEQRPQFSDRIVDVDSANLYENQNQGMEYNHTIPV
ncbi:C6 finger domain-containing protein [Botrytis cinerea]